MPLTDAHRQFLLSRSYSKELLEKEEITSIQSGEAVWHGVKISRQHPVIAWCCRSMGGTIAGISTRRADVHEYRWEQASEADHLPILYGTSDDHDILYKSGNVILAEGIFDRAALKRCIPDYAVYARLSKGIAKHLINLLLRYGKNVWTAFDQDEPGLKATDSAEFKLGERLKPNRLLIPAKDPSALIEDRGERRTREIVERQIRALEI